MMHHIFAQEACRLLEGNKVEQAALSLANALACRNVPLVERIELNNILAKVRSTLPPVFRRFA